MRSVSKHTLLTIVTASSILSELSFYLFLRRSACHRMIRWDVGPPHERLICSYYSHPYGMDRACLRLGKRKRQQAPINVLQGRNMYRDPYLDVHPPETWKDARMGHLKWCGFKTMCPHQRGQRPCLAGSERASVQACKLLYGPLHRSRCARRNKTQRNT